MIESMILSAPDERIRERLAKDLGQTIMARPAPAVNDWRRVTDGIE